MQINLTPEQEAFVRQAIASGRFKSVEEATEAAFDLCEEHEHHHEGHEHHHEGHEHHHEGHEHHHEDLFESLSTSDWLLAAVGVVAILVLSKVKL